MSRQAQLFQQLHFEEEGTEYLTLGLEVTVYWVGSIFDRVEGVLDFYYQSLDLLLYRDHVRFYLTETMKNTEPVRSDTTELLPLWLRSPRRDIYILRLESGANPHASSNRAFEFALEFQDPPRGALRLVLPADVIDKSADQFVELAARLVRKLPFSSGHGGYAINWNKLGRFRTEAKRKLPFIAFRFPGVDLGDASAALLCRSERHPINWLTFFGPGILRPPLAESLRAVLGEGISVYSLENGVLIQAGAYPLLGDTNRQEDLPYYHRVGQVMA